MHFDAEWMTAYCAIVVLFASGIRGYLNVMTKLDRLELGMTKIPEHDSKLDELHDITTRHDERIKTLENRSHPHHI